MQLPFSEVLQANELRDLTGFARTKAQAAWLLEHGVPHRLAGKQLVVSRIHLREWIEGKSFTREIRSTWEPDFTGPGFIDSKPRKQPQWRARS